ncbi:IS1182 family transposase [Gulosibacter molinativorax]|uniref:IS5/IS1182 family transposase n=1 Tax=Gulosibacter molinativorax TaxID=256821 RepID=A0ABT7CC83_9MICO|nr:IS1182 family transposase [Gulosibacter molinativorax]MDJ1372803.1 IS5/IS1182 family transposase [Gulosibacter molinativorax]QUY62298.1 Transposase [Gulosibacter molinativorax]QUY62600.1 Transposase [Gulosibacter molinativorax]QUY62839.1 Transposase [Gulosibacter molinativorax]QUY62962.1 Transposase [Gulosibacter molinativorax]
MQGRDDGQRQLLDVGAFAGHMLPVGSVFAFLAEHRHELFPDDAFADLFPSGRGRPSTPADVIASVMVLQTLHSLSDRETAEAVTFDLRWKAACGFGLTETSFHPTVLTYWRRRLAASTRPHRIFEAVAEVIARSGALSGRKRRALDSTILDDAVARQDTVTQLVAQIRRVGREIPGADTIVAGLPGHDYAQPGKPDIAWDDKAARDDLVSRLVTDALALLAAIDTTMLTEPQQETVALLALVAGQDVEPAEGSDGTDGRWRIARKVAPDRVISTVDPDTRHAHKSREKKQDGFKAHIAIEPDTGLVTAAALTKASGAQNSDAVRGVELVAADTSIGSDMVEVLGDSAYGSGDLLAQVTAAGHVPIIKPMPLSRAVPGGFTIDDFTIDEANRAVICPAGITRSITSKRTVTFGAACAGCPLRAQCTTAARGRKMVLHPQQEIQREHRARALHPDFQSVYRQHRPMVERSIAWMTRGARRVPYRGVVKNNAWWLNRAAGINLKRLLTLGLSSQNGVWVLG